MKINVKNELSVIVPVYNVKEYVEECIKSILNQTYRNLEVILVINAPTDGSDKICERYAEKDSRIRLIYMPENHGVYPAWYTGGMNATGDYVTFVDADDYVDSDYFESMMCDAIHYDVVCSHCSVVSERSKSRNRFSLEPGEYLGYENINEVTSKIWDDDYFPFPATWAKVYKKKIIIEALCELGECREALEWPELLIVGVAFLKCRSLLMVEEFGYNYRLRQGSITRSVHINELSGINTMYNTLKEIFERDVYGRQLIGNLQKFVVRRILDASDRMNFMVENIIPRYFIPFADKIKGKNIVLYSARDVGIDYYKQIHRESLCNVVTWVSWNWKEKESRGLPVESVDKLLVSDYDFVVLAVKRKTTAQQIKNELVDLGVNGEKILWEKPIHILEY